MSTRGVRAGTKSCSARSRPCLSVGGIVSLDEAESARLGCARMGNGGRMRATISPKRRVARARHQVTKE